MMMIFAIFDQHVVLSQKRYRKYKHIVSYNGRLIGSGGDLSKVIMATTLIEWPLTVSCVSAYYRRFIRH